MCDETASRMRSLFWGQLLDFALLIRGEITSPDFIYELTYIRTARFSYLDKALTSEANDGVALYV